MKRFIKYFSIILFSAFFMFLLAEKPVEAVYDRTKNTASVSVNKDEIRIKVTYQRGFSQEAALYKWCEKNDAEETYNADCSPVNTESLNYVSLGGDSRLNYIAKGDASYVDKNLTTYVFVVPSKDDPILKNLDVGHKYVLVVRHTFCALREETGGEYQSCSYYDTEDAYEYTMVEVDSTALVKSHTVNSDITNKDISSMMSKIENIVNGTVMPIIWAVLGLFLVIKGTLLGVQIVKSADEPQVRQEKVGSLKWLVIGVAIAYGTSFVVSVLINFLEKTF